MNFNVGLGKVLGVLITFIIYMAYYTFKDFLKDFIARKSEEAKAHTTNEQYATATKIADTTVKYVEQVFSDLKGKDKLDKATNAFTKALEKQGIELPDEDTRKLIEQSVYDMNQEKKQSEPVKVETSAPTINVTPAGTDIEGKIGNFNELFAENVDTGTTAEDNSSTTDNGEVSQEQVDANTVNTDSTDSGQEVATNTSATTDTSSTTDTTDNTSATDATGNATGDTSADTDVSSESDNADTGNSADADKSEETVTDNTSTAQTTTVNAEGITDASTTVQESTQQAPNVANPNNTTNVIENASADTGEQNNTTPGADINQAKQPD